MATNRGKLWTAALVLTTLVLGLGCNPLGTIAFIFEPENVIEPKCKLSEKDKEVKVVILCYHGNLEDRPELMPADRELSNRVVRCLEESYKEHKEKVVIVHPSQVKGYLSRHPDWHTMSRQDIGKHFGADYVINIEINSITLYERGSGNRLFHGQAELTLTAIDVKKPDGEGDKYFETMRGEVPIRDAGDMSVTDFRGRLLDNLARNVAQRFAAFPPKNRFDPDSME